jgi:anti-sigma B factor antagonist
MVQQPFHIEELSGGPTERRVLRLSGPLWLASVQQFQTVVRAEEDRGLILDVTGVPIVDSAGIAALVAEAIIHQKQGHTIALVGISERVRNTLRVTQVEKFFTYFWTVEEAQNGQASV